MAKRTVPTCKQGTVLNCTTYRQTSDRTLVRYDVPHNRIGYSIGRDETETLHDAWEAKAPKTSAENDR